MPPMPSLPYFVFSRISIKSILLFLSDNAKEEATIAGSKACILIRLGLYAKLAPALISAS